MQLEHICDMELVYREEPLYHGKFLLIRPYDGEEGTGYGEGDGRVTGPKLQGSLRWVNHPHRRSDGTMLPDAHGSLLRMITPSSCLRSRDGRFLSWIKANSCSALSLKRRQNHIAVSTRHSVFWRD